MKTQTKTTRKTTYAERLAARKAKRLRPVHPATIAARERRCSAQHIITARVFAADTAGSVN